MVVSDCHIERISVDKPKAHAPLVVDANAPLSGSVSVQRFQTVGGRKSQFIRAGADMQDQLPVGDFLRIAGSFSLRKSNI